jgi:hypothetical protein
MQMNCCWITFHVVYFSSIFSKKYLSDDPGNLTSSLYTARNVFWGELGGALEAIDAGTTMVVDHAHTNFSPEHCKYIIPTPSHLALGYN